jgi:hypothetical protein
MAEYCRQHTRLVKELVLFKQIAKSKTGTGFARALLQEGSGT